MFSVFEIPLLVLSKTMNFQNGNTTHKYTGAGVVCVKERFHVMFIMWNMGLIQGIPTHDHIVEEIGHVVHCQICDTNHTWY